MRRARYQVGNNVIRRLIKTRVCFTWIRNQCNRATTSESRGHYHRWWWYRKSVLPTVECLRKILLTSRCMMRGTMWGANMGRRNCCPRRCRPGTSAYRNILKEKRRVRGQDNIRTRSPGTMRSRISSGSTDRSRDGRSRMSLTSATRRK